METAITETREPALDCPTCGGHGYHLYRTFCVCVCGTVYQDYANIDTVVYDQSYAQKYVGPNIRAAYRRATSLYLPQIMALTSGRRMLEIGAVVEVTLRAFLDEAWDVTGCDINPHARGDLPFLVGDFEMLDVNGSYDCIWASHVFEHFRDPLAALGKVHRLLSDDGVAFIAMPDPGQIDFESVNSWGHLHEKEHHNMFSLARFVDLAREAGFEPVSMRINTRPEDGFICWTDYHTLLVKASHPAAAQTCAFPTLSPPPSPVEVTRCRWHGVDYELLPFELRDTTFWLTEGLRRGISIPRGEGDTLAIHFDAVEIKPFPFYRDPHESFALMASI